MGDYVRRNVYFDHRLVPYLLLLIFVLFYFRIQHGVQIIMHNNNEILFGINIYEDKPIYLPNQAFLMERDENQNQIINNNQLLRIIAMVMMMTSSSLNSIFILHQLLLLGMIFKQQHHHKIKVLNDQLRKLFVHRRKLENQRCYSKEVRDSFKSRGSLRKRSLF